MTTTLDLERTEAAQPAPLDPKRFRALAVIAIAQLMVVLDSRRRDHRPALGPAFAPHLDGQPAMDADGVHPRLRRPPAARRTHRRLPGSQAHVHRQPDRLRGRVGPGRSGRELGHAVRCPRPARGVRRHHGPGGAVAAHRGLHRAQGAGPGLRRLRRDRRRRCGHRPHSRRRADPVRLLALDAADQRPHRHRRRHHRRPASSPRAGARPATATTSPARSP